VIVRCPLSPTDLSHCQFKRYISEQEQLLNNRTSNNEQPIKTDRTKSVFEVSHIMGELSELLTEKQNNGANLNWVSYE
jgi:hypothetical protein